MKMYTWASHFRVSLRNLHRNSWMTAASISAVTVGLLIAGLVALLIINVNVFVTQVESELIIKVFMESGLTQEHKSTLEARISQHPAVAKVTYIDEEDSFEILRQQFGDDADVLAGLDAEGLLWDGYEIEVAEATNIASVAEAVAGFKGVEEVVYGKAYINDILSVTNYIRILGSSLALAICIASIFVIFNTIRLTVLMRQDEITIMRYVGATNWFIRWPFLFEGLIIGLGGALISGILLYAGYHQFAGWFNTAISYLQIVPPQAIITKLFGFLCGAGAFLGVSGSVLSMRKFLNS